MHDLRIFVGVIAGSENTIVNVVAVDISIAEGGYMCVRSPGHNSWSKVSVVCRNNREI